MSTNLKINVYDSVNLNRLLGWFNSRELPCLPVYGHRLKFACIRSVPARSFPEDVPMNCLVEFDSVEFILGTDKEVEKDTNGWQSQAALYTDSPLSLLMKIPSFRLPDETYSDSLRRLYRDGYLH